MNIGSTTRGQLGVLAVCMLLLASCRGQQEPVAAEVPQLEVKAEIAQAQTAVVTAAFDGRVQIVHVTEGAAVKAGDVVVTIENPTVARDLAHSRAQVALAEHRLRNADAPRRAASPRNDNDDRIDAIQDIVKSRKTRLDRYEQLFQTRDITADELENARMEHAAALRDLAAERNARQQVQAAPADPTLLQLDLERARAEAAIIEDRQRQLNVTSPMSGIVTRIRTSPGQSVFPRDPLLEVANFSTVEVRGLVAPELLRYVRAGMPVEVKVFTVPPRRFTATVRNIVPATDAKGATLVVPISNPDGVLQPGTAATITVR